MPTRPVSSEPPHPYEFERLVASMYARFGYQVCETRGERGMELGADFVAEKNGRRIVVQVKCSGKLRGAGIGAVRQAVTARHVYGAQSAHVVTNTSFTQSARKSAKQLNIRLIGRPSLLKLMTLDELRDFHRIDKAAREWRAAMKNAPQAAKDRAT